MGELIGDEAGRLEVELYGEIDAGDVACQQPMATFVVGQPAPGIGDSFLG